MNRHGLARADFEGPRFVRLRRIEELRSAGRIDDRLRMVDATVG
ncbi:hypothetical protein [Nocardioides sp. TF02-7]|nr:hypothetical protein [Nocardioides sp. TF02-7]